RSDIGFWADSEGSNDPSQSGSLRALEGAGRGAGDGVAVEARFAGSDTFVHLGRIVAWELLGDAQALLLRIAVALGAAGKKQRHGRAAKGRIPESPHHACSPSEEDLRSLRIVAASTDDQALIRSLPTGQVPAPRTDRLRAGLKATSSPDNGDILNQRPHGLQPYKSLLMPYSS